MAGGTPIPALIGASRMMANPNSARLGMVMRILAMPMTTRSAFLFREISMPAVTPIVMENGREAAIMKRCLPSSDRTLG